VTRGQLHDLVKNLLITSLLRAPPRFWLKAALHLAHKLPLDTHPNRQPTKSRLNSTSGSSAGRPLSSQYRVPYPLVDKVEPDGHIDVAQQMVR
jgi:hypothetical protein